MNVIEEQNNNAVDLAVQTLKNGGLIIFPTETSYGVGADATNSKAVEKLINYKKRPSGKPISIGVVDELMALRFVELNNTATNIYKEFLPGPVTVISKSKGIVDKRLESEKGALGVRIPDRKLILEIIKKLNNPITTTSANSAYKKTPYSISDVLSTLNESQKSLIDLIIDGGNLPKRLTSSVIDTTTDELKTYRKGSIDFSKKEIKGSYITNSFEETINLGEVLMKKNLDKLKPVIFLLRGDLGAGKTHFVKGLAKVLGINQVIKSPTYTYVEEYALSYFKKSNNNRNGLLYHIDAWKLETKEDLEIFGFKNWIKPGNILAIEWPEILENLGFKFNEGKIIDLEFKIITKDKRKVIKR